MQEPNLAAELQQQQPEITVDKLVFRKSLVVQKVWAFLHTPQPRANSSPVGGWTTCKGHSVPSSCLPLGPVTEDNVYTLALNLLVGKYKKRSSYCTLGRCRERRTGCQKYFVILELYRCKNIMFLKQACHKTFLCSLVSVKTADTVDDNNNSNNRNGRCKHRSSKRSAASFEQCDQVTADHYSE